MKTITFPKDFIFGVATSAAQIEGAAHVDGRSDSIWDTFARKSGVIADNSTPETACDFYHTYPKDLDLARKLNMNSFRFSFSWSRLFPDGTGQINQKGLDFYKRMIDCIRDHGMIPNATVYHWDLPQALQDKGGWLNRDIVHWFSDYASVLFKTFGKEIPLWATVNEPIAIYVGHADGIFAPGGRSEADGRLANHHLLLAHGESVQRFRDENLSDSKIGIVVDIWKHHPLRPEHPDDIAKAELANEKTYRSYLHPLFCGGYTDALTTYMQSNGCMPTIQNGDFALIQQPLDFFGLNCYNRVVDCADPIYAQQLQAKRMQGGNFQDDGDFYPKAIYDALHLLKDEFNLQIPVYITENGTAGKADFISSDGCVHDEDRIRYLKGFLYWLHKAMEEGADVRGYYAWSLLDNWEWIGGYQSRFGLVHVDYETQQRLIKDSGKWFSNVASTHTIDFEEGAP